MSAKAKARIEARLARELGPDRGGVTVGRKLGRLSYSVPLPASNAVRDAAHEAYYEDPLHGVQAADLEPRKGARPGEVLAALVAAGYPARSIRTEGGRDEPDEEWWVIFDGTATQEQLESVAAAAKTIHTDPTPRLKGELEAVLERRARLSVEPDIYADELADLDAKRAEIKAKITAARGRA